MNIATLLSTTICDKRRQAACKMEQNQNEHEPNRKVAISKGLIHYKLQHIRDIATPNQFECSMFMMNVP